METNATALQPARAIRCDGCGLPASPEHLADRLSRLELATRFRPIHMDVLFVVSSPAKRPEDDFYGPPRSSEFFVRLMQALGIASSSETSQTKDWGMAALLEFQRRGFYLAYLSECPVIGTGDGSDLAESKLPGNSKTGLAATLVKRIKFNYKPRHVALLGADLRPLIGAFEREGLASLLLLDRGNPLEVPQVGDTPILKRFRETLATSTSGGKSFL